MKKEGTIKLITFGRRGHTLYIDDIHPEYSNVTCSGYEDPESFVKPYHWWADAPGIMRTHLDGYDMPAEGVPVIDVRAAVDTEDGLKYALRGPIVNVRLKAGEVSECPIPSECMISGLVAEGGYGALVASHIDSRVNKSRSPLDEVSVSEFVAGWREHGARVGKFIDNRIVWE